MTIDNFPPQRMATISVKTMCSIVHVLTTQHVQYHRNILRLSEVMAIRCRLCLAAMATI